MRCVPLHTSTSLHRSARVAPSLVIVPLLTALSLFSYFRGAAQAESSSVSRAGRAGKRAGQTPGQTSAGTPDEIPVEIKDMSITPAGVALTLVSDETEQELHLMIGPAEGQAIVRALRHAQLDRPQTHDLMKTLVEAGGWSVSRVIIRDLRNQTYYADIVLQRPGAFGLEGNVEEMTIDARPSDAMALGLRFDAKIFVRQSVFDAEQKNLERDEPEEMVNPDEPETLTI